MPSLGIPTTGTAMASGKRAVRFFVSCAHADRPLFEALVKELKTQFASSSSYEFSVWTDRDILIGEDWRESIEKALRACDFGLLLLSPAFLGSRFIGESELPHFVGEPDYLAIEKRLDAFFSPPPSPPSMPREPEIRPSDTLAGRLPVLEIPLHLQRPRGYGVSLADSEKLDTKSPSPAAQAS